MAAQRLPMEIILQIIDSVVDNPAEIYSPESEVTKTLLSFTRVCRATYAHASNHLRRQCMYIDDEERLADCVAYLQATNRLVPEYNDGKIENAKGASPRARLCPITSLYLAPFYDEDDLDDVPYRYIEAGLHQTFTDIVKLCTLVGSSLASLILDVPDWALSDKLADEYSDWDNELADEYFDSDRAYEREWFIGEFFLAFSSLTELRDFICVRDSFVSHFDDFMAERLTSTPTNKKYPWHLWPKLQRLALHERSANSKFWRSVRKAKHLHTLILLNPTLLESGRHKTAFLRTISASPHTSQNGTKSVKPPRPIKIIIAAYLRRKSLDGLRRSLLEGVSNRPLIDPDNLIELRLCDVPVLVTEETRVWSQDTDTVIASAAVRGEIWRWEGDIIS